MGYNGKFVLALDCGTQSIRGLVFDQYGNMVLKVKKDILPYFSERPGWAEQDPDLYYNKICEICNTIRQEHVNVYHSIISVTITTMRDCCIIVDKKGKPLRPAILWMDQREVPKPKPMKPQYKMAVSAIGMYQTANKISMNCKAHWIQEFEKDLWSKTHKFLLLSSYLNYKLTGKYIDSVANQIGHIPLNYKKFKWDSKIGLKRQIMQVEREKLVDLVPPGTVIGKIDSNVSKETGLKKGIVVIASGSDKGCETLGVGCINNNRVSISLGSQATIQTTSKKYYEVNRFIPPFPAVLQGYYNPELQIYRGYWMLTWFKKEFALKEVELAKDLCKSPEEVLNEYLKEVPPGCDGLILQPYWGSPIKNPEARGAIIGFSDYHTRIHIYRAIIEGIGYGLYDGMKRIERRSGQRVEKVMISGGGSQSDVICQITADIFNRPVYRVQTYETSGLGAAILSYVTLGIYKDFEEAVKKMVHVSKPFKPQPENVNIYSEIYHRVYHKIYKRLKPLYEDLKGIYSSSHI